MLGRVPDFKMRMGVVMRCLLHKMELRARYGSRVSSITSRSAGLIQGASGIRKNVRIGGVSGGQLVEVFEAFERKHGRFSIKKTRWSGSCW
jgi:hypothetical protein